MNIPPKHFRSYSISKISQKDQNKVDMTPKYIKSRKSENKNITKQVEAELGRAQPKLGLS